ncbi:protein translocase subunit SecF [Candidatus Erwinia haradaeae]|uniref:Protein-export membrane protein SecF n=1 Tax=Candidatus Erwinia haradaeae TaxID=1922217 RepID=A0A451DMZ3_9GAMM|nr:protein translocase subunit SecF [Candidatus Erwinia haradaeae]VFP88057.1 Protein translocase subunit SecF [Candidatus Erwinia haradaeae]
MFEKNDNTDINYRENVVQFMNWKTTAFSVSALLLMLSLIIISMRGFYWGLDFTGGTIIEVVLQKQANLDHMRSKLKELGFTKIQVQNFGSSHDYIIHIPLQKKYLNTDLGGQILRSIQHAIPEKINVKRIEYVGPRVGSELLIIGGIALLSALIAIFLYITIRFAWRLALGIVLALIHDLIITIGALSLFQIEIDFTIIASLLSVIGYSLNDKIVVSDRIRENCRKISTIASSFVCIINLSITQTFRRTIITSIITLMMVLILFIFGGSMLRGFSLTMLIGIIIGTISSIYTSSSLALQLGIQRDHLISNREDKVTEE